MDDALIEVDHLAKRFPEGRPLSRLLRQSSSAVTVLCDVSFSVRPGQFFALLGSNGAGKTTVLKTLATLLLPDAGELRVCGHDVVREARQVRRQLAYILADERSFHWRLTARENLEFFAALSSLPQRDADQRIASLLQRLDLEQVGNQTFSRFSTGMKQRLAVARALLTRPRVLLMDEPTRSVDATHAAEVWRLVQEEVQAVNGCLILVTHQIQEALALCDSIAVLAGGRLAVQSTASEVEQLTAGLDGFSLAVRGLASGDLDDLRAFPGVRDLRIASQIAGEQLIDVWSENDELPLVAFLGEITARGATICSLQRTTPLQAVLARLQASQGQRIRHEVAV